MSSDQNPQRESSSADAKEGHEQVNRAAESTPLNTTQRPSYLSRSSLESTATTLPSYSERPDRPPTYSSAANSSRPSNATAEPRRQPKPSSAAGPSGVSAASISAIMATSSSENDKMHSKSSKKVNDWNEDSTYKSKLARMTGSTKKWNYFGADIGGNPFRRSGKGK